MGHVPTISPFVSFVSLVTKERIFLQIFSGMAKFLSLLYRTRTGRHHTISLWESFLLNIFCQCHSNFSAYHLVVPLLFPQEEGNTYLAYC